MKNIKERERETKGSGCASVLFELALGVEHFVQLNIQIILQLVKVAAGYWSFCSPYQHRYCVILEGKVHTQETLQFCTIIHLHFNGQFSFLFFFQMKPQLPHSWFSTPSVALFLFFPNVASQSCGFLTTHRAQEVCCLKTGPYHCFHSSSRTTMLNLTPITRSQVSKILTSTYIEV